MIKDIEIRKKQLKSLIILLPFLTVYLIRLLLKTTLPVYQQCVREEQDSRRESSLTTHSFQGE